MISHKNIFVVFSWLSMIGCITSSKKNLSNGEVSYNLKKIIASAEAIGFYPTKFTDQDTGVYTYLSKNKIIQLFQTPFQEDAVHFSKAVNYAVAVYLTNGNVSTPFIELG